MDFDFSVITDHLSFLGSGIAVTLLLSVLSGVTSLVAGFFVALLRLYGPRWLRPLVVLYIDSMRAIPVLVVLVWTFFALAIVRMLPAFGSLLSITIKDTAIASVIAVLELMRQSETLAGQSFQPIEVFSFAMLVYFLILFPVTRGVDMF